MPSIDDHSRAGAGQLVFAAAMSHAPGISAFPRAAEEATRERFLHAAGILRDRLAASRADALIVIAPDHFSNFFLNNMPSACVTLNAAYEGPVEDWLGFPRTSVPGAPAFARSLLETAFDGGFELSFSEHAELDHGVMVPLKLLQPDLKLPIVWVMLNCQVAPLMSLRRCYELGRVLRRAVDAASMRVGVLASGGLSHNPGAPESELDPTFDRHFLSLLNAGDLESLFAITNERIDEAGFGTWEIRLWLMALGVAHDRRATTLAYEPVPQWDTACAVAIYE
jgi:aromatic ring-opening dioxygenase catalytic subunit (LigB family)